MVGFEDGRVCEPRSAGPPPHHAGKSKETDTPPTPTPEPPEKSTALPTPWF